MHRFVVQSVRVRASSHLHRCDLHEQRGLYLQPGASACCCSGRSSHRGVLEQSQQRGAHACATLRQGVHCVSEANQATGALGAIAADDARRARMVKIGKLYENACEIMVEMQGLHYNGTSKRLIRSPGSDRRAKSRFHPQTTRPHA
mgnify:CR=1 FL=1